jgi:hypothetical protein
LLVGFIIGILLCVGGENPWTRELFDNLKAEREREKEVRMPIFVEQKF